MLHDLLVPDQLRINNFIAGTNGEYFRVYAIEHKYKTVWEINNIKIDERTISDYFEPIKITREILRDNLGFEIHDLGDYWQCEKEDFVLIQPKLQILSVEMSFIFVLKSSIKEAITFDQVHHLQNTYLDLKNQLLEWKN